MKKHIVCFGDSNTHGYCAKTGGRFDEKQRWTCLLQEKLGGGCLVIEEGLCGRTACFSDPFFEGRSGLDAIYPCLMSHEPVDLLVIMLGTNDTKERLGANASCIAIGMERLVRKAQSVDCWGDHAPNILIVCPPPIRPEMELAECGEPMGKGCLEKTRELHKYYKKTARLVGAHYLDAKDCEFNAVDGMHLTRKGHAQLAALLAELVPGLLPG